MNNISICKTKKTTKNFSGTLYLLAPISSYQGVEYPKDFNSRSKHLMHKDHFNTTTQNS